MNISILVCSKCFEMIYKLSWFWFMLQQTLTYNVIHHFELTTTFSSLSDIFTHICGVRMTSAYNIYIYGTLCKIAKWYLV